ncbi:hypothetical protein BGX33_010176 [Mortierella sp. NVP41]|nr:hypothetical protein BGX33_010176 [Mortierella sp. NVP41]
MCIAEPTYGITINAKELNIQTATARDHLSDYRFDFIVRVEGSGSFPPNLAQRRSLSDEIP